MNKPHRVSVNEEHKEMHTYAITGLAIASIAME